MGLFDLFRSNKIDLEKRFNELAQDLVVTGNYPYFGGINNIGTYTPGIDYEVSSHSAMGISTYYTCVLVRGESLSTLPCGVFKSTSKGSTPDYKDPNYVLLHNKPNPFQTASDFWKTVSAHIDNNGNCYAIISYSGRFQPQRYDIVEDPDSVTILRTEQGNKLFQINGKTYQDYEVLHFKDLSLDGVYGCSKVRLQRSTLGYAKHLGRFGNNAIDTTPSGYFSTEANFDTVKKQEDNLSDSWREKTRIGKVPVLPNGLKFNQMSLSPEDAQYLESKDATDEHICGFMRVPPTLVQNYKRATFSNAEQQDLVFVKYTMLPLITNIEQECNAKLFAEGNAESEFPKYVKFNVNAFMRGDYTTRTNGYRTMINTGVMTINEARAFEEMSQIPGGDDHYVPMNLVTLKQQQAFIDHLTQPVQSNSADPGGNPAPRSEAGVTMKDLIESINGHKYNGHAK